MSTQAHVFLVGDQTYDINKGLRELLHSETDPLLTSFFEKTHYALRDQIRKLPYEQRTQFQRFSSLTDLLILRQRGQLHPAFDQALASVYQLGIFISRTVKNGGNYPQSTDSYVVGLCTGALSAAAIGACRSLSELIPVAVHTVVVAFRTGVCAVDVGRRIEKPSEETNLSWSSVYSGITLENASEALKKFSNNEQLSATSKPYLSASSDQGVTISGPPSILERLRRSPDLKKSNCLNITVYAPYHAPHLFSSDDIESILETTPAEGWTEHTANIPVFSSTSGKPVWADNFRSLLKASLSDILLEPLRIDVLLKGLARATADTGAIVHPISTNVESAFRTALRTDAPPKLSHSPPSKSASAEIDKETPDGRPDRSKIAIVGMSGRFPDAEDPSAFWDLLHKGLDVHKVVPARSWSAETHVDPTGKRKNTSATPYGCWLDHPELFDSKFFFISPREAPQVDPAQRMALMTAYEAIEQAGIVPDGSPSTQKDRVGVYYGCTSQDWMETNSPQNIDTYYIPGGNRAFIPGRINYFFKFSGPSLSIDTACSSSLAAINAGCLSLWRGDTDTVIAGGTNVLTNPDPTAGLDRGHFLSRTGNCKTFDDGADGYCRAEGVGTVVLKRLEDAIADNDPIQGVISGAYTNHSAEAESITRPHVGAQRDIFQKILNHRGTDPYDVSYIEMHGTGTQAGDNSEMTSVLDTFAPPSKTKRRDDQKLYVGSAKANIGHGEAFSGVGALAKVLLMMKNDTIPPHCGIKTKINHRFPTDLADRKVLIADSPKPWQRPANGLRKVMINNFSAAGGNSALLVEDAPRERAVGTDDTRSSHMVAVSAKSAVSLKGNLESLISFLCKSSDDSLLLPRLSYTTTARRMHHTHRVIVTGSNLKEIRSKLETSVDESQGITRATAAPKVVFTFTGQGSQYPGMGKVHFENFSSFRSDIRRLDRIAIAQGFPSILPLITAPGGDIGDYEPVVVQVATTCLEIALYQLWASWGVSPKAVVGHSLGEYAALNAAGVLSESDTIYLVGKRAQLLQEQCKRATHSMLAMKAPLKIIEPLLKGKKYEVACINSPDDTVLSGKNEDIQVVQKTLSSEKIKTTTLKVPYAFHSSQVEPILKDLETRAHGVTYRKPNLPVLCPLQAKVIKETGTYKPSYLSAHCRQPVNLLGAVESAKEAKILTDSSVILEIGPQPVVSGFLKATLGPKTAVLSSMQRGKDSWQILTDTLSKMYAAGMDIKWNEYHRDFAASHKVLDLPAYSWDLKAYWMQYIHDWSLRKGDLPLPAEQLVADGTLSKDSLPANNQPNGKAEVPKLESTTVHKVVEESVNEKNGNIIVESDLARPDMNPLTQGHKVNGVPLVTPSIYADMALTIGRYLLDRYQPQMKEQLVDVADMVLESALVARPENSQLMRVSGKIDWSEKRVACEFLSVDANGKTTQRHAQCCIRFEDPNVGELVQSKMALLKPRIEDLYGGLQSGTTYRFSKSMAYKMVQSLAQFDPTYQAVTEIVLDSNKLESTSQVNFANCKKGGAFHTNPAYINSLSESGGFVMNCNDSANLEKDIFVNHGWKSMRLYEQLSADKIYRTHVKMHETEDKMWKGDIMVMCEDRIVAKFGNILLQGVPRRLMNMILAQGLGQKAQAKQVDKPTAQAPKTNSQTQKPAAKPSAQPKKPTKQKKVKKVAEPKNTVKVLQIISEESGVPLGELTDESNFTDLGVDSLLSMIITSRVKEEIGIDTDTWDFSEYPTVKHLKDLLGGDSGAADREDEGEGEDEEEQEEEVDNENSNETASSPIGAESATTCPTGPVAGGNGDADFERIAQIISEESGVAVEEMTDESVFVDLGVDSLLSLIIAGRCKEELGLDVDTSSMFADIQTVADLKRFVAGLVGEVSSGSPQSVEVEKTEQPVEAQPQDTGADEAEDTDSDASGVHTPQSSESSVGGKDQSRAASPVSVATTVSEGEKENIKPKPAIVNVRPASSVLLQGRPQAGRKTLFLFPDGAGSASSYSSLPKVNPDLAIVGLNCPYARFPEEMTCTLDQLIGSYISELRRRQPVGPYNFGGWSAGGILAYAAAQQIIREGEEVETLVLIDSPVPQGLDKLPQRFMDHCNKIGLWDKSVQPGKEPTPPKTLVPHFNATMDLLKDFYADPLPVGMTPKCSILFATESVMTGDKALPPRDDDVKDMEFLSKKRTDFSPGGWANLFPGDEVTVEKAEGAHHFSMMQGDLGKQTAAFIERATQ